MIKKTLIISALCAGTVLLSPFAASAQTPEGTATATTTTATPVGCCGGPGYYPMGDQYQDTTLGHNSAVGWCQGTSQEVGAGVIAGGSAVQHACNPWHSRYGQYSRQDTTLGHSHQIGGAQSTAQEVGAGVIAGGDAWQG